MDKFQTQNVGEPFPTTGQDLAGFWDMVLIQVEHIKTLFTEIQQLRDNGWVHLLIYELNELKGIYNNYFYRTNRLKRRSW